MTRASTLFLAVLLAATPGAAQEGDTPPRDAPASVLSSLRGKAPQLDATVLVQQIRLAPGQRDARLRLSDDGFVLMQLRAGELSTVIGGERRVREEGEWWSVERASDMALQTEDDAVIIDTILITR